MNKNHMKEVCELLGVELGEKFNITSANSNPHYITETALFDCDDNITDGLLIDLITGNISIEKSILDDKEREYLASVIAPKSIYENVDYITKCQIGKYFRIVIVDKQGVRSRLPCFTDDNMYKGMEVGREYTLEELGLSKYE